MHISRKPNFAISSANLIGSPSSVPAPDVLPMYLYKARFLLFCVCPTAVPYFLVCLFFLICLFKASFHNFQLSVIFLIYFLHLFFSPYHTMSAHALALISTHTPFHHFAIYLGDVSSKLSGTIQLNTR